MLKIHCGVLTISDKGAVGERTDTSGPRLVEILKSNAFTVSTTGIVADERDQIAEILTEWSDTLKLDLILTTGGTGISPRDVTPEATQAVIEREIPGMGEAMRAASLRITPYAMLSRGVAGIRGKTIIINLPGSEKGARENLETALPALRHAIDRLQGGRADCGHRSE